MNEYQLNELASDFAEDIAREIEQYGGEFCDLAWQYADSSEYAIYHHKAHDICRNCDTSRGEELLEEFGGIQSNDTYDSIACKIAFGELYSRIAEKESAQ